MPRPKPKPQARGLAEGLRNARRETKLALIEVAQKLEWSQSTLSRIENGKRNASVEEVSALLAVYQVTGDRREVLLELARDIDRSSWLETRYATVPEQTKTLAQHEAEAVRIVNAGLILVSGLLQTAAYARALMYAGGVKPTDIEARVSLRLERQEVLNGPTELTAFMDEGALRHQFGGSRVMAGQMRHLLAMAEQPNVTLRVIPFDVGGHAGVNGAYDLLEFEDAPPVVHLENRRSLVFFHEPKDVDPYLEATASMNAVALDAMQSVQMIEAIADNYD